MEASVVGRTFYNSLLLCSFKLVLIALVVSNAYNSNNQIALWLIIWSSRIQNRSSDHMESSTGVCNISDPSKSSESQS